MDRCRSRSVATTFHEFPTVLLLQRTHFAAVVVLSHRERPLRFVELLVLICVGVRGVRGRRLGDSARRKIARLYVLL